MDNPSQFENEYEQAIGPLVSRLNERYWEATRGTTIGGAGLSTAVVFLLTQIGLKSASLAISFFCSALAIPVWLALWQVTEAYSFYGKSSHGHFQKMQGSGVGVLIFLLGGLLLLVSFFTLIWHFSIIAAIAFLLASIGMVVFVYKHNAAVRLWADQHASDGT